MSNQNETAQEVEQVEEEFFMDGLQINIDNIANCQYEEKSFQKGMSKESELAGRITALLNTGITTQQAVDLIMNMQNIDFQIESTKLINESNLEIAKIKGLELEAQKM